MNWLVIAVLLFLGFYAWRGYSNGFIKTVFSIFAVVIAMVVAFAVSPYLSKVLQQNETVYSYIEDKVDHVVDLEDSVNAYGQTEVIDKLPLPNSIKESLSENNNKSMYELLHVDSLEGYIVMSLTVMILNGVAYLVLFVLAFIVIKIIAGALDLISKLPILNSINKMAGLAIGILRGLIVIWILCIVVTVLSSTQIGQTMFTYINESEFLSFIYNNNLIIRMIADAAKTFL